MANRNAYAWGACILAAGALLAVAVLWRLGPASAAPAVVAVDLTLGAALLHCALAIYGAAGALGAVALMALSPQVMAWNGAVWPSLAAMAQLAAVYTLMRCVLDPTAQGALAAGVAIAASVLAAALLGEPPAAGALGVVAFSLLLVAARTWTAEPPERRRRVAHAAVVSMALAWGVAGALLLVAARVATLPSPDDFSALPSSSIQPVAVTAVATERSAGGVVPASTGVVPVVLAALRPWRRQRRYSDLAWLLALGCLALPLWRAAAGWPNAFAVVMPPLAVLAGGSWDAWRPAWARRAATVVVIVHAAAVLAGWLALSSGERVGPALQAAARGVEAS